MGSMPLLPFCLFTILGAGAWNTFLTWCGFTLRRTGRTVLRYSHVIDIVVVGLLAALVVLYIARHLMRHKKRPSEDGL